MMEIYPITVMGSLTRLASARSSSKAARRSTRPPNRTNTKSGSPTITRAYRRRDSQHVRAASPTSCAPRPHAKRETTSPNPAREPLPRHAQPRVAVTDRQPAMNVSLAGDHAQIPAPSHGRVPAGSPIG